MKTVFSRVLVFLVVVTARAPSASAFDGCRFSDVNRDKVVDASDFGLLVKALGTADPRLDLDGNGTVGKEDAAMMLGFVGMNCSKSCPADLDRDRDVDADDRARVEADLGLDCRPDLDRDGFVDADGTSDDDDADMLDVYLGQAAAPYSSEARADFVYNQLIDSVDEAVLAAAVPRDCRSDLNSDGAVDLTDIWVLLASWGPCP